MTKRCWMTVGMEMMNGFVREFEGIGKHSKEWVNELRAAGRDAFERVGYPTTSQEEWRDTNVRVLAEREVKRAGKAGSAEAEGLVRKYRFGDAAAAELVFVNGHFAAGLSRVDGLPKGVRVVSLGEA